MRTFTITATWSAELVGTSTFLAKNSDNAKAVYQEHGFGTSRMRGAVRQRTTQGTEKPFDGSNTRAPVQGKRCLVPQFMPEAARQLPKRPERPSWHPAPVVPGRPCEGMRPLADEGCQAPCRLPCLAAQVDRDHQAPPASPPGQLHHSCQGMDPSTSRSPGSAATSPTGKQVLAKRRPRPVTGQLPPPAKATSEHHPSLRAAPPAARASTAPRSRP
mmetsp:Transcript_86790/g.201943  ORF Transcript_86790/g.201943 Transcript_86790/m.201943 type:complete len:216 (-) Transcript_86790:2333-2980(-)